MPTDSDQYCFACGQNNPIGLHLHFDYSEEGARACFVPERVHQGYPGMMHGGLVSTLLDEAMAHVVGYAAGDAVTGALEVRMRGRGVPIGQPVYLRGWITGRRSRLVMVEAEIRDEVGALLAEAKGKFMLVEEKGLNF